MPCAHVFADPRRECGHEAVGGSERCLWHNAAVGKTDPYVKALFLHADGRHHVFAEAHLAGIDLSDLPLGGRDFAGADLRDATLDRAVLAGASFIDANLRRASCRGADLRGADLRGANLSGTSFAGADLRDADLSGAVLDGTVLLGADLRGANLEGAQVTDFQWNRLTRFQGVRGLDARPAEESDGDTTQVFLAPVAMEDLDTPARLALDRDPELARTRFFSVGRSGSAELPPPDVSASDFSAPELPAPPRPGLRRPWLLVPALAGLLVGAGAMAAIRPSQPPAPGVQEMAALRAQREADGQQIRELQDRATALADQLATLQQGAGADGARAELLRQQLGEAQADLARLLDADDRATSLQVAAGAQERLSRDLAGVNSRQERLSRILADGVERFRSDSERLTGELAEARSRLASLEATQAENVRLRQRVTALGSERDELAGLNKAASGELTTAKKDIERYLARISGSQLAGLLTEEGNGAPLVPLTAGKPVSLGGDYLVTLSVAPAANQPATIDVRLVIQRPAASANPDATIVLYDERKRPLRRIASSFPHVDRGAPFVAIGASVSCDRMPAFARVVLAPGIEDVAAR